MKKSEIKSPGNPEDRAPAPVEMLETTTPEEKRAILRSRAKKLAQGNEKEGTAGDYVEVLVFLLGHETYAIETAFIREVYPLEDLTPLPCTPAYIFGIMNIRGQILTVMDMKKFFALPEKGITNLNKVIVAKKDATEMGILADEIVGIRNILRSGVHPPPPAMTGIEAGYLKGATSERLIIIDIDSLLTDKKLMVHEEV